MEERAAAMRVAGRAASGAVLVAGDVLVAVTVLVAGAVACVLTLAGCSGSDGGARQQVAPVKRSSSTPSTSTSVAASTTSMPKIPLVDAPPMDNPTIRGVVEGYMAWTNAYNTAASIGDPDYPPYRATVADDAWPGFRKLISERSDAGELLRMPAQSKSIVRFRDLTMLDAESAQLTVCGVDDAERFDRSSGKVIDDAVVVFRSVASLTKTESRWLMTDQRPQVGADACAV